LDAGKFRVQHVWDTEAQKTMVKPRKRAQPAQEFVTVVEKDDEATIVRPRQPVEPLVRRSLCCRVGPARTVADIRPFFKDDIGIRAEARDTSRRNQELDGLARPDNCSFVVFSTTVTNSCAGCARLRGLTMVFCASVSHTCCTRNLPASNPDRREAQR